MREPADLLVSLSLATLMVVLIVVIHFIGGGSGDGVGGNHIRNGGIDTYYPAGDGDGSIGRRQSRGFSRPQVTETLIRC